MTVETVNPRTHQHCLCIFCNYALSGVIKVLSHEPWGAAMSIVNMEAYVERLLAHK